MGQQSLQIKFTGESHQIDANTLINVLIHYNSVIMLANDAYSNGAKKVNLNVNAIQKGSFVIDLSLNTSFLGTIFSVDNIAYLSGLITIVGGVLKAYKSLKGKPAKTEGDITIINNTLKNVNVNISQTVINVYNKKETRSAISSAVETASLDDNVDGINISSEDKLQFEIDRDEFDDLIYKDFDSEDVEPEEKVEEIDNVRLTIKALSFQRGSVWTFFYQGFQIKSTMKDDALMAAIDKGAQFGKGDAIKVKLRIVKKYNKTYNVYENKSYKIVEFHSIEKAPHLEQTLIDCDE